MLPLPFYEQHSVDLAQALLGCELLHTLDGITTSGIIVETEAYRQDDEASHSFRGMTKRNEVMFGPAGRAYVYFTYGMHYCFNVVGGREGSAEAVLIRALEPLKGIAAMEERRGTAERTNLCSGPGKLVQALGISKADNGTSLDSERLHILGRQIRPKIAPTPRIGIKSATKKPWRFIIQDSPYLTKHKFNKQASYS